jgi:pilus assembly protein CpaF
MTPQELVAHGTLNSALLEFLGRAVAARCTILICGGTGSGKTTTLGALAAYIDRSERVVTIEDAAELRLALPHVVRLEARPPNLEGRGEVTIRRLVRNALRMRPDRLIVGEVRGPEAFDLLVALSTGHAGSLCTIHAGSAAESIRRLETLALMADVDLPLAAIREQVADALDLVVRQERGADGIRRIVEVAEVVRVAGGPGMRELFTIRAGRPFWRAPLGDTRAGRLAAAGAEASSAAGPSARSTSAGSPDRPAGPAARSTPAGSPDRAAGPAATDSSRAPGPASFLPPEPPR